MTKIVSQTDGLDKIFIQTQTTADGAGDLSNLQGVGQARSIRVPVSQRSHKDLRFVHKPAECFGVHDAIAITLKLGAHVRLGLGSLPVKQRR